jgi:hypothetical protein
VPGKCIAELIYVWRSQVADMRNLRPRGTYARSTHCNCVVPAILMCGVGMVASLHKSILPSSFCGSAWPTLTSSAAGGARNRERAPHGTQCAAGWSLSDSGAQHVAGHPRLPTDADADADADMVLSPARSKLPSVVSIRLLGLIRQLQLLAFVAPWSPVCFGTILALYGRGFTFDHFDAGGSCP